MDDRKNFEELCCQLARSEEIPNSVEFVRNGDPDGGVECFWKLNDGSEWGWQAKFFRNSPRPSQWKQIDKSVRTAIKNYPKLAKYFICLPTNLSNSKARGKPSRKKWNEYVKKWKKIKNIDFKYWGSSEIEGRLLKKENCGKREYFFNKDFFPIDWFEKHADDVTTTAGFRYTPDLNIELDIAKVFDNLGRTPKFYEKLEKECENIMEYFDKIKSLKKIQNSHRIKLKLHIDEILNLLDSAMKKEQKEIDFEKICANVSKSFKIINMMIDELKKKNTDRILDGAIYDVTMLYRQLSRFKKIITSNYALVANTKTLLLSGDAGMGKTHLMCDLLVNRLELNQYSILLFGSHFNEGTVERKILEELDLTKWDFEEFLGGLNAVGEASNTKVIIMIDGINEGKGSIIWPKYLGRLLEKISRYTWIAIAISIRTLSEDIIPEELKCKFSKITHPGFKFNLDQAVKVFFDGNGIDRPNIPLLKYEFSNPQFLFLFCKGLKNAGLKKIPKEIDNLLSVYNFFIDGVNKILSKPERLDYKRNKNIVQKAVEMLAEEMANKETRLLTYSNAEHVLEPIYPSTGNTNSLIENLISEGILNEDTMKTKDGNELFVQFSFERLGDHLIIKNQLKDVRKNDVVKLFKKNGKFFKYFKDYSTHKKYRRMMEAISIQLPENFKKEIIEINPAIKKIDAIYDEFLESFVWRSSKSVNKKSLLLIEKEIINKKKHLDKLFKILLKIGTDPEHLLNAIFLHKKLSAYNMSERDEMWTIFLHKNFYEENSIVKQYIDWAWNVDKSNISKKSIYLAGLILTWFLTSSNRSIRDRATKALTSLLFNDVGVLIKILIKFENCDDLYVRERLFCIAYGCAIRNDHKELKMLAKYVYQSIFKNKNPPPNLFLREYAKMIIDHALFRNIKLDIIYERIKPPYDTKRNISIPNEKIIKKQESKYEKISKQNIGTLHIISSLSSWGNFYRYIMKGNMNNFEWSMIPLLSGRQSRATQLNKFCKTLTAKQTKEWNIYYHLVIKKELKYVEKNDKKESCIRVKDENFFEILPMFEKEFKSQLNTKQRKIFNKHILPYMKYHTGIKKIESFNLRALACWVTDRIFDMGWTEKKFGKFDHNVSANKDRVTTNTVERIGKKYQWIAYYELLAIISDNYEFKDNEFYGPPFKEYQNTAQLSGKRNIDPSILFEQTFENATGLNWWFPFEPDWDLNNDKWLKNDSDVSSLESIIEVVNKKDDSRWLVLGGFSSLSSHHSYKTNYLYKHLFFKLTCYLCKKSDVKKLYDWGTKQDYRSEGFPDPETISDLFLSEIYWDPEQQDINERRIFEKGEYDKLPAGVVSLMHGYLHEKNDLDGSIAQTINIRLPNNLLVKKMKLNNKLNAEFVDSKDELIAYDPSVNDSGPSMLLIKKDKFLEFLQKNNYGVIWQIIGQKQILDRNMGFGQWKGCLDIRGIFRIMNNKVVGKTKSKYIDKDTINRYHKSIEHENRLGMDNIKGKD